MINQPSEQDNYDEKLLLLNLKDGNALSFDFFYKQYSQQIYRKLKKMVKIEFLAEELMQDVFIKVWDKRSLIDPTKSFKSYLFTIAQNLVYDHYRRVGREAKLQQEIKQEFIEEYLHLDEGLILKETQDLLEMAINALPAQQQTVFRLCKIENKSYQQVSQQLGISISTVNGHIVRASKSVKTYLLTHNSFPLVITLFLLSKALKNIF